MKIVLLIFSFLIGLQGFSQKYGDENFYLVDSLDLQTLSPLDIVLIDSNLTQFHTAESDTSAINSILLIIEKCSNNVASEKYNHYIYKFANLNKDNPHSSPQEIRFYYRVIAQSYGNQGFFEYDIGNISGALDYYYEAQKMCEELEDNRLLADLYIQLGALFYSMGEEILAREYCLKSRVILDSLDNTEDLELFVLNNLAVMSGENGDFDESLDYYSQALEICVATEDLFGAGMIHNNLGGVYAQVDSFALAFNSFEQSLEIFLDLQDDKWLSHIYQKLGSTHLTINNFEEAKRLAILSYDHAQKSGQILPKMRASHLLYRVYNKQGDFEKALYHYQQHQYLSDSISNEKLKLIAMEKELTYQNEKEKAIAAKENEKKWEIAKAEEKQREFVTYSILLGLILVVIFSIVLYSRLRVTTRQKNVIEKQNNERKLLLKEIHHRVKNNFQIVSSVLKLQAAEEDNRVLDYAFDDAVNRIHSMAAVHEMIYKQEDFAAIVPKDYFIKLTNSMRSYSLDRNIDFEIDSNVDALNIQVLIPLGISVNEMITNSIKYAFKDISGDPKIRIQLEKNASDFVLSYQDNGVGIGNNAGTESFGMELIKTIIDQIDGRLEQVNDDNWNTHLRILFR